MSKEGRVWLALAVLFVVAILLVSRFSAADNKPYSSYSTEPDGAKAAYLLLKDLGFQVQRHSGKEWRGEGVLLALGSEYLGDVGGALTLPEDYRFTNEYIGENAALFVERLWPYHGSTVAFYEYGRSLYPHNNAAGADMTLWSILPAWLRLILLGGALIAFFLMFFYGQRLGEPLVAEGFFRRPPLESVYAMAAALEKSSTYKDCAGYYYRYCARHGAYWDKEGQLAAGIGQLANERAACKLLAEIDQRVKEYRNEGK
jgi:hypothetical protein